MPFHIPLLCQLSGKDGLSVSACMEVGFLITLKMTALTKHQEFVEWNAFLIPISPFPHFLISHFSISSFLTFRVLRMRISTCTSNLTGHLCVLLIGEVWELVWSEGKALCRQNSRSERGGRMVTAGGGSTTPASGRKTSGAKTV